MFVLLLGEDREVETSTILNNYYQDQLTKFNFNQFHFDRINRIHYLGFNRF